MRQRNLAILLACQICQCEDSLNEANLGSVPTVGHRERGREEGKGVSGESERKLKIPLRPLSKSCSVSVVTNCLLCLEIRVLGFLEDF